MVGDPAGSEIKKDTPQDEPQTHISHAPKAHYKSTMGVAQCLVCGTQTDGAILYCSESCRLAQAMEEKTTNRSQPAKEESAEASQAAEEETDGLSPSQSPESDASSATTERRLDERKQEIINTVISYATEQLRLNLAQIRCVTNGSDPDSAPAGGFPNPVPGPANPCGAHSNSASSKRKRHAADDDAADSGAEDGGDSKDPDHAEPPSNQSSHAPTSSITLRSTRIGEFVLALAGLTFTGSSTSS